MLAHLVPIAHQFTVSAQMFKRLIGDFTDADWVMRDSSGHDARWIAGHLALTRCRLAMMIGAHDVSDEFVSAFQRGTKPDAVPDDLTPQRIVTAYQAAHDSMAGQWDLVDEDRLAKPIGRTLPDGSTTVAGALCFLAWHEAYHLGQLGLLRRLAGKPGLA